ncbi:threonine--tRNA ligase [bacterium]|nr:threonine--tRNA ligase [bacterium]
MESLKKKRHSASHILAMAVKRLFPQAKLGIGPAIDNGFYYDFSNVEIKEDDLPRLEKEAKKIILSGVEFRRKELSPKEAQKVFQNEPFKLELIKDLAKRNKKISVYYSGDFVDLCEGPHINSSQELNAQGFKLLNLAGAYWRGKETNPMLVRVYGTYFDSKEELEAYLQKLKEIKKRDHKVLGKKLDLFGIYPKEIGSGLVLWHPQGAVIREEVENFWKDVHKKEGYQLVYTPHIGRVGLWKKSGHFQHYREMMYSPIEMPDETYLLKPMNCPFHVQIYKSEQRSYRDLPIKYAELGTVYRYEKKGVLLGLLRVRGFTQDDAHIFCRQDQLEEEIAKVFNLAKKMLKVFGFKKLEIELAVRDKENKKDYIGSEEVWQKAERALREILKKEKVDFHEGEGEAKFYGPSIDIKLLDSLGRAWQGPTIQVDFNFPEKFDLYFINEKGKKERPVMIHRTVLGAMERFIGGLIEHYAGAFPLWLAPVQIALVPVAEKHLALAKKVADHLSGFRVKVYSSSETVSKRIKKAEEDKVPYVLVLGDKEKGLKTKLPVRIRGGKIKNMTLESFGSYLAEKVANKSLNL